MWLVFTSISCLCSLDYPGVGPEHSFLKDMGRAEYFGVTDNEALEGMEIASGYPHILSAHFTCHCGIS